MNEDQKQFYTKLTALAGMCPSFVLSKEIISVYDQHLSNLGYPRASAALDQIILERNSRDPFPSVKEILALANPELDKESHAALIANEIVELISRCGPYQTPELSDVAKRVVQMEGGWQTLCEMTTYDNLPTFKAQWRNLAKSILTQKHILGSDPRPTLPGGSKPFQLPEFMKELPK